MASIFLPQASLSNLTFASMVAEANDGQVIEEGSGIRIEAAPQLVIHRYMANEAFAMDTKSTLEASWIWRSLVLNRTGHVVRFDEDEIVIADEPEASKWASVRVLRETKQLIEEWAEKLAMPQSKLVDEAVRDFVARLEA